MAMDLEEVLTTFRRRPKKAKSEDMSKRITESDAIGPNLRAAKVASRTDNSDNTKIGPNFTPKKDTKSTKKDKPTPDGLRGSATGEIGPDMGKVNTAAEAYADAQARDAASRITEGGTDFSGMSRVAPEERVDMHEQARRSMGFKKGGAVRKKSGSSCGMKSGGSVKSSASRRGDGCAVRGKTKGRLL